MMLGGSKLDFLNMIPFIENVRLLVVEEQATGASDYMIIGQAKPH
jgi:hypothetical protein